MVKYKVNLIFKENGKSFDETIIDVLKIELEKQINNLCTNFKMEMPLEFNHYSQNQRSINE